MSVTAADTSARFHGLLEEHRRILYKVARAYAETAADRDDLAQEIAAQLWRSFARFDPALRFSTWMYRVALNVAISWRRRERRRTRHLVTEGDRPLLEARAPEPGRGAADGPEVALLYAAIARFDPLARALLILHLDGLGHAEIGSVLGLTTTNVATKLGRLKDRLRAEFRAAGHL